VKVLINYYFEPYNLYFAYIPGSEIIFVENYTIN